MTVEEIAKLIAVNYADWPAYIGKAKKIIKYFKTKKEPDLFQ